MKPTQQPDHNRRNLFKTAAGLGLGLMGFATPLLAQAASKVFIASSGNDANNGSRASPMRTLQAAHDAVAADGEIAILDTAGYGALNITKNVRVTVPSGVSGFITAASGTAVTVNTGLSVTLRGLVIEAAAAGVSQGIFVNAVTSLLLENCSITGFGSSGNLNGTGGIVINTSSVVGSVIITDTVISDCPGSAISHGDFGNPSDSLLVVERCRLLSSGQGLAALTSGRVAIRNSVVANNAGAGIHGGGAGNTDVKVMVENCVVTGNGTGIIAFASGNVTVSNSTITGNTTGVAGSPLTYNNNQLSKNTTDGTMGAIVAPK
jgi:parallel beta-helix repeat protein